MRGTWAMCQSQWVVEIEGKKTPRNFPKATADSGDGARLDDQEQRPAVEKAPEGPERLAQVDVLPAGPGHHGREFAVAQSADQGHDPGDDPCAHVKRRRVDAAGDVGIDDEDARADHGADYDGRGAEEAKALGQAGRRSARFRIRMSCSFWSRHVESFLAGFARIDSGLIKNWSDLKHTAG